MSGADVDRGPVGSRRHCGQERRLGDVVDVDHVADLAAAAVEVQRQPQRRPHPEPRHYPAVRVLLHDLRLTVDREVPHDCVRGVLAARVKAVWCSPQTFVLA